MVFVMTPLAYGLYALYGGVEQLVARRAHNPKVVGSSPTPATTGLHCERTVIMDFRVNLGNGI